AANLEGRRPGLEARRLDGTPWHWGEGGVRCSARLCPREELTPKELLGRPAGPGRRRQFPARGPTGRCRFGSPGLTTRLAPTGNAGGQQLTDEEAPAGGGRGDSPYQGYEVQRLARWVDHALPFSLLLLGVFIRQHLQESCWSEDDGSSSFQLSLYCVGFFVMIWITAVMFKSNDILRKQTALKQATRLGERPCHCHDGCSFWPDRGMKTCGIPSFGRTSSSGGLHVMS
ncbi:uncharacterized protein LOC125529822, partial [Triticum urartu]